MGIEAKLNEYTERENWSCVCDFCGGKTRRYGFLNPGDAADAARKEGWTTVPAGLGQPMRWKCRSCVERAELRKQAETAPPSETTKSQ
jgi:hypothetical protein